MNIALSVQAPIGAVPLCADRTFGGQDRQQ